MLPYAYEPAAALFLVIGGAIACFAGYRLFRTVLAIYGFILGALMASSMMGSTNTIGMILAAVVGGVLGAVVLTFAYFVAIALIGAVLLQRYIIVVGTALVGAWTLLVGALALTAERGTVRPPSGGNVWILYPFAPAPGQRWLPVAFVALGAIGAAVQLGVTGRKRASA